MHVVICLTYAGVGRAGNGIGLDRVWTRWTSCPSRGAVVHAAGPGGREGEGEGEREREEEEEEVLLTAYNK